MDYSKTDILSSKSNEEHIYLDYLCISIIVLFCNLLKYNVNVDLSRWVEYRQPILYCHLQVLLSVLST